MKFLSGVVFVLVVVFAFISMRPETGNEITDSRVSSVPAKSYILQGANSNHLNAVVGNVGGNVSREFPIINAVSAVLTPSQVDTIRALGGIRIQDDRTVRTMGVGNAKSQVQEKQYVIDNLIAKQTGANLLHNAGITGKGVTVAVIDSGTNLGGTIGSHLFRDTAGSQRVAVKYDAIRGRKSYYYNDDANGHGTHVSGIISSSLQDDNGNYNGIAPDVYLLSVRAFNSNGNSSYSKVLDALNWIYENRYTYKIRVVNMSLGADVDSYYWNDPINLAVMRLWDAGIVVVTSAGNNGKDAGITVPGNNPYVITVGAVTDSATPYDVEDDRLATFSSKGPTIEGFIKPEVVTYGTNIASKMDERYFKKALNLSETGENYSEISGTSQASAIVAGVAALIISNNPYISPDDVKCKIISSAKAASDGSTLSYSPFQQGAGLVSAYDAVNNTQTGCANTNLNIGEDLAGVAHFNGPARVDDNGIPYIELGDGSILSEGINWISETNGNGNSNKKKAHWSGNQIGLEGAHWVSYELNSVTTDLNSDTIELLGSHWSNTLVGLQGAHWADKSLDLLGSHWSMNILELQGAHWGDGYLLLQGAHWGLSDGVGLQSHELNPEPIDPTIAIDLEEAGWQ